MTQSQRSAVDIAVAYHDAWTSGRIDEAMTYLADNFVADAPRAGHVTESQIWREALEEYVGILTGSTLVAAFGDNTSALVHYFQDTELASGAPTVEYVTVENAQIVYLRVIFDRTPFEAARNAAAAS